MATVAVMLELYCRARHKGEDLCPECRELLEYARARLGKCRFGEGKSTCRCCRIHCYRPDMREKIRVVMRYAGPRLVLHHPGLAFHHLLAALERPPEA